MSVFAKIDFSICIECTKYVINLIHVKNMIAFVGRGSGVVPASFVSKGLKEGQGC